MRCVFLSLRGLSQAFPLTRLGYVRTPAKRTGHVTGFIPARDPVVVDLAEVLMGPPAEDWEAFDTERERRLEMEALERNCVDPCDSDWLRRCARARVCVCLRLWGWGGAV